MADERSVYAPGVLLVPLGVEAGLSLPPAKVGLAAWVSEGGGGERGDWVLGVGETPVEAGLNLGQQLAAHPGHQPTRFVMLEAAAGRLVDCKTLNTQTRREVADSQGHTLPAAELLVRVATSALGLRPGMLAFAPAPLPPGE